MSWSRVGRTRVVATGPSPKMPPSIELLSIAIAEEFASELVGDSANRWGSGDDNQTNTMGDEQLTEEQIADASLRVRGCGPYDTQVSENNEGTSHEPGG